MVNFKGIGAGFILLIIIFGRITFADDGVRVPSSAICPLKSVKDSILDSRDFTCHLDGIDSFSIREAIEGDEASLQRASIIVRESSQNYVSLLFYASWCPFSTSFRPTFSIMASLFPSISHFVIEESAIRPSILSKYGVHGFPTLFLMNSTMRVQYHGSRTLHSLANFYKDVGGVSPASINGPSVDCLDKMGYAMDHEKHGRNAVESCPFSWARSPENLLQQETYLALATAFVLLRLMVILFPVVRRATRFVWRKYIMNTRFRNMWDHPRVYLHRAVQVCNSLKEPGKRSNLQEGAMNAKAWASKSLASVSFGEASVSRGVPES